MKGLGVVKSRFLDHVFDVFLRLGFERTFGLHYDDFGIDFGVTFGTFAPSASRNLSGGAWRSLGQAGAAPGNGVRDAVRDPFSRAVAKMTVVKQTPSNQSYTDMGQSSDPSGPVGACRDISGSDGFPSEP